MTKELAKGRHRLRGGRVGVGKGKNFSGYITAVPDLQQRLSDGCHGSMTESHCTPVAVRKMDMTNHCTSIAYTGGEGRFFQIHVEEVGEQSDVTGAQGAYEIHRVTDLIEEVGLISIKRLKKERCASGFRSCTEHFECMREVREC